MIKLRFFLIVCIVIGMISCDDKQVFDTYHTVANAWEMDEKASFILPELDTTQSYNLFINIRNNNEYKYSNLFLISEMKFPNGKILTDTLEYRLAAPDGSWLGTGFSDLKEKGNYTITIEHAMRKNGEVNGISSLEGITDIGFRIENVQNP